MATDRQGLSLGRWEKRFARAGVGVGIVVSVFHVIYTFHWNQTVLDSQVQTARIMIGSILAVVAVLLLVCWKLQPSVQIYVALAVLPGLLVLYAAEIYTWRAVVAPGTAALRAGRTWDSRNLHEVIADLRQQGTEAVPLITPSALCKLKPGGISVDGVKMLPLGGISNKWTAFGNESGMFVVYQSDEHGFNNPKGIWTVSQLDVAVVGDSFAQGDYVPPEQNLVAHLRARYPATLNLGMSGNGPLIELAGIKEDLPTLRPRIVLWLFYENDISDLVREATIPILVRYLQPDFRQGLLARQEEIDGQLEQLSAESERNSNQSPKRWPSWLASIGLTRRVTPLWIQDLVMGENATSQVGVVGLQHLRGLLVNRWMYSVKAPKRDDLLSKVLQEAQTTVASWGGKLYFVYMPSYEILERKGKEAPPIRTSVLDLAHSLGIPTIDLYQKFQMQANPLALFPYPHSHYNEEGYRVAAEGILDFLPAQ